MNENEQKAIEEIRHIVENYFEDRLIIGSNDLARKLYKIAVPENSVVLSSEEYEKLHSFDLAFNILAKSNPVLISAEEYEELKQSRKETAREIYLLAVAIINATKYIVQGREYLHIDALKEIIKQCGVEVEE